MDWSSVLLLFSSHIFLSFFFLSNFIEISLTLYLSFFACFKFMIFLISQNSISECSCFCFMDSINWDIFPGILTALFYFLTSSFPWGWKLYLFNLVFLIHATCFVQISTDSWLSVHIWEWKNMLVSVVSWLGSPGILITSVSVHRPVWLQPSFFLWVCGLGAGRSADRLTPPSLWTLHATIRGLYGGDTSNSKEPSFSPGQAFICY